MLSTNTKNLFDLSRPIPPRFRGLPAAPFLVPAILDSLNESKYAAVTEVVHGEADSFCAATARTTGGIVLTSDSDLLVHDLGPAGAVVFFDNLELQQCEGEHYYMSARVAASSSIAQRLSLNNLCRFAFELKEDSSLTLQEVQRRAQTDIRTDRAKDYEAFRKEYNEVSTDDAAKPFPSIELLDPRICEMILQCHDRSKESVHMYMPFLIEDPSRSSAWNVSVALRSLAYSLVAYCGTPPQQKQSVLEHSRRDTRIVPIKIELIDHASLLRNAGSLNRQLEMVWKRYPTSQTRVIWRIFGIIEVFSWYFENGRTFPMREATVKCLWGNNDNFISWQDVHLSAQLQAALYSARLLKQVLVYLSSHSVLGLDAFFLELLQRLKDLPSLKDLLSEDFSAGVAVPDTECGPMLDFIRSSARNKENAELSDKGDIVLASISNGLNNNSVDETTTWVTVGSKHKKLKRRSKTPIENGIMSKESLKQTNNIFGMLANV